MRAKRRQELKTNDLAQWLEEMSISVKDWAVYVIGGVAVVVVVMVIVSYLRGAKADAVGHAYTELQQASVLTSGGQTKTPDEVTQALQKIGDLANETGDTAFKLDALLSKAGLAMASAETSGTDSAKRLDEARAAFQQVIDGYQDHPLHYGRALAGMYQLEAQAFVHDQDPKHKVKAAEYLGKIRDDTRLARTPLNGMAVDTLNNLDDIFSVVKFPNRPVKPAAVSSVLPIESTAPPASTEVPADAGSAAPSEAPPEKAPAAAVPTEAAPVPSPAAPAPPETAPSAPPAAAPQEAGSNG